MNFDSILKQSQTLNWVVGRDIIAPNAVELTTIYLSPSFDCLSVILIDREGTYYLADNGTTFERYKREQARRRYMNEGPVLDTEAPERVYLFNRRLVMETTQEGWVNDAQILLEFMQKLMGMSPAQHRQVEDPAEVADETSLIVTAMDKLTDSEVPGDQSSVGELSLDDLRERLSPKPVLQRKGDGRVGILTDVLYRDGDPCEIFLAESPKPGGIRVTDGGAAIGHLGHKLETGEEHRRSAERIALAQGLNFQDGAIFIDSSLAELKKNVQKLFVCLIQLSCLTVLSDSDRWSEGLL